MSFSTRSSQFIVRSLGALCILFSLVLAAESNIPDAYTVQLPFKHAQVHQEAIEQELEHGLLSIRYADQHQKYLSSIRYAQSDVFIVNAHFAEWLNRVHNYLPVAQLSQPSPTLLIHPKEDIDVFDYTDLMRKPVCNFIPLDAGFMMLAELYQDYPSSPLIENGYDTTKLVENEDLNGCKGVVISQRQFERLDSQLSSKYEILGASKNADTLILMASIDALTRITQQEPVLIRSPVIQSLRQISQNLANSQNYRAEWKKVDKQILKNARSSLLDQYWPQDKPE
jgi:hypothetical protein